jgi:acetyl-CoA carboxylase biotin carboxyl carrier protein
MDLRKLKTLIDLVSESNISELEITEAEGKVRIVKSEMAGTVGVHPHASNNFAQNANAANTRAPGDQAQYTHGLSNPQAVSSQQNVNSLGAQLPGDAQTLSQSSAQSITAGQLSLQELGASTASAQGVAQVAPAEQIAKSPMVGTFYRSSSPGGKPFVEIGSVVKQGETICIIEAMKILNEIEAEHSGTVTQILVKDGQAVEYGQSLMVIE